MDSRKCPLKIYWENNKTLLVVGAGSSIGNALLPELMDKYESVILTEVPEVYGELVERYSEYGGAAKLYFRELDVRNREDIHNCDHILGYQCVFGI